MHKSRQTSRIAFQGEPGANSDIAARKKYPDMTPTPYDTFEGVFNALEKHEVDLAIIPIDNSLAGRVADIHYLIPRSNNHIVGEYFLPIHFCLMAKKGASLDSIKTVCSHIHALGQCRNIIRKNNWQTRVAGDTAGSARVISQKEDLTIAAIAPKLAARIYNLEILARDIADAKHNFTRFIILSNEKIRAERGKGEVITSFIFRVQNIPSALYKAMGGFATNSVNMTKLESYQANSQFFATQFYADIEGHPEDYNVKLAMDELRFFCDDLRILGVYPASDFRNP